MQAIASALGKTDWFLHGRKGQHVEAKFESLMQEFDDIKQGIGLQRTSKRFFPPESTTAGRQTGMRHQIFPGETNDLLV